MTQKHRNVASAIVMVAGLAGGGAAWHFGWPILAAGVTLCCCTGVAWQVFRSRRFWRYLFCTLLLLTGTPPLLTGLHQIWCRYQPRPRPTRVDLFEGIEYIREVLGEPSPAVIHMLRVDLAADGVQVLVTPPDDLDDEYPLRARTTSLFLEEFGLQAAINANNFSPFDRSDPRTYLTVTSGRKTVLGGAASRGVRYGEPRRYCSVLNITRANHAEIQPDWPDVPYNAVAGVTQFIVDGRPKEISTDPVEALDQVDEELRARSAVGIDRTGSILFLIVVDGDLAPYSTGIARSTLTEVLLKHGVYNALSLDGGGSSTMVIEGDGGAPQRLNRPVQGTIPGIERPVGNHIGIYARRFAEE